MEIRRRRSAVVRIGPVAIGGANPIAIQSMAKCKTADVARTLRQIRQLQAGGCEIARVAVKDNDDARAIKKIKQGIKIPLVADIHFNWRLAIQAIDHGADKVRLNPGNIFERRQVREVAHAARLNRIPIRVGVNSGSLASRPAPKIRHQGQTDRMVSCALGYARMLERFNFHDIVISLKAADGLETIEAYRRIARVCDYPLHIGVTATGSPFAGAIKSSVALGALLLQGIGDTLRVSLTAEPQEEVEAAKQILAALGLRHFGIQIISCPTCGRCAVNLADIVSSFEKRLAGLNSRLGNLPLKIALMGCVVNGPGEAREADAAVAFGNKYGLLFLRGRPLKKVSAQECLDSLSKEIERTFGKKQLLKER